jgi:ribonucleotide reductase beta subunit family protein with ferritin-like domain
MNIVPLLPPERQELLSFYKRARAAFWVEDEIPYTADIPEWDRMSPEERHFMELVLGFFAVSDRIVLANLVGNFIQEITIPEAQLFYNFQAAVEDIHSLTYTNHLLTLVKDPVRIEQLLNSIEHFPSIRKKSEWATKWMDRSRPVAQRLIAFAVVEAVYFCASFCSIFWFKEQNKLVKGVGYSNEFIARDEGLHAAFACALYKNCFDKVPDETIREIIRDAVEVECEFVDEALPSAFVGMNADLMKQYVRYVADRLAFQLGCSEPIWGGSNPFVFMERLSLIGKDNFFEKKVSNYGKVTQSISQEELTCMLEDF